MDNSLYLQQRGVYDLEARKRCLDAMEKYQENHWWEPDVDPRTYGYYQLKEKIMLSKMDRFHEALEQLLGRSVYSHELRLRHDALIEEAERAWKGEVLSQEERQQNIVAGMQALAKHAKEKNKQIVVVSPPEQHREN